MGRFIPDKNKVNIGLFLGKLLPLRPVKWKVNLSQYSIIYLWKMKI